MADTRDPRLAPRAGDIVRSTTYKNGRERHVISVSGNTIQYIAVSPTNRRTMQCWRQPWVDWCHKNKAEVAQVGP